MATIIQQPASVNFSATVPDIIFGSSAHHSVVTVTVEYASTTETVFEETLFPDNDSRISLVEMSELLNPYVEARLNVIARATIREYDSSDTLLGTSSTDEFTVLYANVDVGEDAQQFAQNHFLTILNGTKLTAMGWDERIYAYGVQQVTVAATYIDEDNALVTKTATLTAAGTTDAISAFFVGPNDVIALIGAQWGTLVRYTVSAGTRSQTFEIRHGRDAAPHLGFINSFGCIEFIHCTGTVKKDSKFERDQTRIRGMLRNYKVTEKRNFTANTGWLPSPMADWADELFRSKEVYLWDGGQPSREVVVGDSTSIITNDDDNLPSFEFTYEYAQRQHNVMQRTHAGRIFDYTFDHTFN